MGRNLRPAILRIALSNEPTQGIKTIDIGLGSAAAKLTDKILGYNNDDVVDIMSDIATEYGLAHIAHVRLSSKNGNESTLFASFTTYSREWQARYFLKQYITSLLQNCANG